MEFKAALQRVKHDRSISTDLLNFDGIYLPNKPPIDKIAAYTLIELNCSEQLTYVAFHNTNSFPREEIEKWEKEKNVVCVDLGDRKYHNLTEGSATEWAANRFSLARKPGVKKLIELINTNNRKGNLKGAHGAVALLLRDFYELTDNSSYHVEVIRAASDVIVKFMSVENGHAASIGRPENAPMEEGVQALFNQFKAGAADPLTLGQYVKNMWLLGHTPGYIVERMQFWLDGCEKRKQRRDAARHAWETMKKEEFSLRGGKGLVLRTDDYFLHKILPRGAYAVRVIVREDKHVTISTNGLGVAALANELIGREPDRWYFQKDSGTLINGGVQYTGVPPTRHSVEQLVDLVAKHLRAEPQQDRHPAPKKFKKQ